MTATLAPPSAARRSPSLAAAVRAAAHSDAVVFGGVLVWTAVLAALSWGRWGDLTMDTGYDMLAASRTADGELPYVDYTYFYGPLGPLLLGAIYSVTGAAVWPAVVLGLVLALLAIWLTFRVARVFVAPLPAGFAAALVAVATVSSANNSYVLPHATSAPLGIVLALAALLLLIRAQDAPGDRARRVAGGVLCGLVAATRPELAFPLIAAVACWLGVGVLRAGPERGAAWRSLAAVLAPALLVPALAYGAFLTSVSPGELLYDNLYPRDFIAAAGSVVLESHAPLTAGSVAELLARSVAYAAAAAGLVWLGVLAGRRGAGTLAWIVVGGTALVAGVVAARPETVRYYLELAYAWVPLGAAIAAGAFMWRSRRPDASAAERSTALVCTFLALAVASTYASFKPFPNALHPEATPYILPLAAVFIAWVHASLLPRDRTAVRAVGTWWLAMLALASAGLMVHDARSESATVRGAHGTLRAQPADAPALQAALAAIDEHTRPGDPILLAPQLTALYVMSDRENPLRELSLLPGTLATAEDERRAIARMEDVRLVVTDRSPMTAYEHGAFGDTFGRTLHDWLESEFISTPLARSHGHDGLALDVWIRRSP